MMRVALLVGLTAIVAIASGSTSLPQHVQNTLTPIDTIPTKQQLDSAFNNSPQMALQNLSEIASDGAADVGIRLRAIHALAKYCGDAVTPCSTSDLAHQALAALIADSSSETTGAPVLLLRAAIETLGTLGVATDVGVLVPMLDHPSRDIRAAAARALQELCNTQAITPLRVRYSGEDIEQVRLAISEALRILNQCSANP
jgi:HEAT repeat protein